MQAAWLEAPGMSAEIGPLTYLNKLLKDCFPEKSHYLHHSSTECFLVKSQVWRSASLVLCLMLFSAYLFIYFEIDPWECVAQ